MIITMQGVMIIPASLDPAGCWFKSLAWSEAVTGNTQIGPPDTAAVDTGCWIESSDETGADGDTCKVVALLERASRDGAL